MTSHLAEAGRTLIPRKDDRYGLLSPALVILTYVAGLVDALSYLALGHVFVANVTGNIVFLGFSIAHAQGFVWWTSALTLVAFMVGALIGGRIIHYFGHHRARHLLVSTGVQALFVIAALVGIRLLNQFMPAAATSSGPSLNFPTANHIDLHIILLIVLLAPAMGIQNSTARKLSVPDLPTTVLTMTLTGVVADTSAHGHEKSKLGRRAVVMVALALGALTGALLQTHGHEDVILMVMIGCLLAVMAMMFPHLTSTAPWATGQTHHSQHHTRMASFAAST
ncbi:membrane protein [Bifidobacterium sp. UTCIF-37]|uniref:Membrane protein n=1 Tax=Bifidobacterium callitrichos DSM 23973 TaxID=1437609 RepID=A0A087A5L3_9BIFI|nr:MULTISPECIES: YoaK family protein [Bifidobacterium]KFI54063.1 membrane protein [Bifidobacterium callitrichos DSM 23973]TPF85634.1 membrane protein [Bifidobacterium sp. UTCIF-37]TPF87737.1 membrane protein [Bifidobacterium sp. UTCIF-38]